MMWCSGSDRQKPVLCLLPTQFPEVLISAGSIDDVAPRAECLPPPPPPHHSL